MADGDGDDQDNLQHYEQRRSRRIETKVLPSNRIKKGEEIKMERG